MNKNGKWGWIVGGGLVAAAAGYFAWAQRRRFLVGDITTGESAAYPELRSRVYYADTARTLTAAEQALRRMPRWELVSLDTENEAIEAKVAAPIGLLTDDVTIYAVPLGHGQTRVTIRSRAHMGGGDWGRNAAHIRRLQGAMDSRLNADAAF